MIGSRTVLTGAAALACLATTIVTAQTVTLVPVASGLDQPVYVTHAGDGSGRLFIVEQTGSIRVFDGAQLLGTPFLDISSLVSCCGERGLLSVAFHPDYESNGQFYVDYTDIAGDTVVTRYAVSPGNPNVADPASAFTVLTVDQDFPTHNGGQLQFSPNDGYLYISVGDGGSAGDPNDRGQSLDTLLGKILRIDVDSGVHYGIPPDNPYVGIDGLDEIWANGLRNPWRFSFDRATGDMFIGDVGQNSFEEVDFQPAESAGCENYGWRLMEASSCFNPPSNCSLGLPSGCNPVGELVLPILEYAHENNPCDAVTGGYRYRGTDVPALDGLYVFGDYCRGTIWAAEEFVHEYLGPPLVLGEPPPPGPPAITEWISEVLVDSLLGVSSFGEDEDGELYVVDIGGTVSRIAPVVALSPPSGRYSVTQDLDLVIRIYLADVSVEAVEMALDGEAWHADFGICETVGRMPHGGLTLRCRDLGRLLAPGHQVISVGVVLEDGRRFDGGVTWHIEATPED